MVDKTTRCAVCVKSFACNDKGENANDNNEADAFFYDARKTTTRRQSRQNRHTLHNLKASYIYRSPAIVLLLLSSLWLIMASLTAQLTPLLPMANAEISDYIPININDGPTNLEEGQRLFQLGRYADASAHLWRAVVLHTQGENKNLYKVDDAFTPFLQCYLLQNKIVDGLVFISAESYMRGQDNMGRLYLGQALERDSGHAGALELKQIVSDAGNGIENDGTIGISLDQGNGLDIKNALTFKRIKEIRDNADASNPKNQKIERKGSSDDGFWSQFSENRDKDTKDMDDKSPEDIYNTATYYFNTKNFPFAEQLFELSCQKSSNKLSVACTNAVYLRTNLCDWGYQGEGFEKDMKIIKEVTRAEMNMYRSLESDVSDEVKRLSGIGYSHNDEDGVIHWQRSVSVHPHMMLGYPLDNENVILKRYAAESMASMDELRARVDDDGTIKDLPKDLPYKVEDMRDEFIKKHQEQLQKHGSSAPIKVGFVACSFNSKAVLYLSHDMFRFFDPSVVEVHVFSTGPPDNPRFIQEVMRGVNWRQRIIDTVDYFHDVREHQLDHIGLARYIREHEIQILIEWDGYARQGERAAGLMALRPAPIQILHQEFLMTSGAQYFDYIVTDKVVSPLDLEHLYTEKFLYLPNHFFSKGHRVQKEVIPPQMDYIQKKIGSGFRIGVGTPQENACLSSNPLGTKNDGKEQDVSFVYCNFNKFLKNNPETMLSWLRILEEVPNSILCMLENPKEGVANLRKFVTEVATSADVNNDCGTTGNGKPDLNDRIHFIPWEKNPFDHQQRSYSLCNVMLDSHPYNGHTTAQDSLYAGVPIVTRSDGNDMSSRVSTSANVVLGLEELNAHGGSAEYENIAIRLGTDTSWFSSIRARLVDSCLQKDPIMHPYWDVPRYVENFQSGLKIAWDRFLDGKEKKHIEVVEDGKLKGTTETFPLCHNLTPINVALGFYAGSLPGFNFSAGSGARLLVEGLGLVERTPWSNGRNSHIMVASRTDPELELRLVARVRSESWDVQLAALVEDFEINVDAYLTAISKLFV
ncbi:hypothetical protein ACHAXR_006329 [Thalassiosira sp. AJA248-18]